MHREKLLTLLNSYQPSDHDEIDYKKRMIDFVMRNPLCFERTLEEGHMTGSSLLLNKAGTHALLLHHAKLARWFQLGGHADGDPDILAVSLKEAQEESGIQNIKPVQKEIFDIDIHLFPKRGEFPAHFHYDVRFLLQVVSEEQIEQNRESKELRWVNTDLPTKERSVTRLFEKWQKISKT